MTSSHKTSTIAVMWISAAVMMGMITTNNPDMGAGAVILSVLVFLGVVSATIAITQAGVVGDNGSNAKAGGQSKIKNSDSALVDRLLDSMSEEELAVLRRRLGDEALAVGDDGELVQIQRRR